MTYLSPWCWFSAVRGTIKRTIWWRVPVDLLRVVLTDARGYVVVEVVSVKMNVECTKPRKKSSESKRVHCL